MKNQYNPDTVTPPGETILETMAYAGISPEKLCFERVDRGYFDKVIQGKERITVTFAGTLELVLGVPSQFWLNRDKRYWEKMDSSKLKNGVFVQCSCGASGEINPFTREITWFN